MLYDLRKLPNADAYRLLVGSVQPRPIAWVSTVDDEGHTNLAPFSFFMACCSNPPTLAFTTNRRGRDATKKDTLRNLELTGECVINVVAESVAEAMNQTAAELPYGDDEFAFAGLTKVASQIVVPPRVGESPISFECRVRQIVTISDEPGGGSIVVVTALLAHVSDEVLDGHRVATDRLRPVGRLAGDYYARTTDVFAMRRP